MDIFAYRDNLIRDYRAYVESFLKIEDARVQAFVLEALEKGALWTDPLIQLNPNFMPGAWVDALVDEGLLQEGCRQVFRKGKSLERRGFQGQPFRLHRHQEDALRAAARNQSYVLTTGTGSGKSLAYILPIVDHVLRHGSGRGIQAIVVYPMNALANSQYGELEKFLKAGFPEGQEPVTFKRYTGQEKEQEREAIMANPPDIILTNYVMMELILTRPDERRSLIKAAKGLKYFVMDELHTYRGRQGSDVALLLRRVRETLKSQDMLMVGTSATMGGGNTFADRQDCVAKVATRIFGTEVLPENVIGETLQRATADSGLEPAARNLALRARIEDAAFTIPATFEAFRRDPLSAWIEETFGVHLEDGTDRLERAEPLTLEASGKLLHELTGCPEINCQAAIRRWLLHSYTCEANPETGFKPFAFRLHQFISKGDAVYASLESAEDRYLTLHAQQFVPDTNRSKVLLPMAFCRECGHESFVVWLVTQENGSVLLQQRAVSRMVHEGAPAEPGFVSFLPNDWPTDRDELLRRLPEDWTEEFHGTLRLKRDRDAWVPYPISVKPDGVLGHGGRPMLFQPAPFRFCPFCGVAYTHRIRSDFAKLATLSSEGRSTATTVLSLSAVQGLRQVDGLGSTARKLLSFTDNRQDASLQAGHFNDYVEIGLLRAALFQAAVSKGAEGLRHDDLTSRVFDAIALPVHLYARDPEVKFAARQETDRALRDVLGYRLYRDLRRGWRITMPNLEQCGLLTIDYLSLEELCLAEPEWQATNHLLASAHSSLRERWCRVLLDAMRRELAVKVDFLDPRQQEGLRSRSSQRLLAPWALDENEKLDIARILYPRQRNRSEDDEDRDALYFGSRSGFGQYMRRELQGPNDGVRPCTDDVQAVIRDLLRILRVAGLVEVVDDPQGEGQVPGYQIPASALIWKSGTGLTPYNDPLRMPRLPGIEQRRTNPFFVTFYRERAKGLQGFEAREHTAQVSNEERKIREKRFREGNLPVLYCSPTMELGVDISDLNVVNLRNIPPTPANYAQRSGRAGRSGQPALVFSYCSTGSSHDQYFYRRQTRMVAGRVDAPRLDLSNEDLLRAHIHAIWLAEANLNLRRSLREILDCDGENPSLEIVGDLKADMAMDGPKAATLSKAEVILLGLKEDLAITGWYTPEWLTTVIHQMERRFEAACERWRTMFRLAHRQIDIQTRVIKDVSRPQDHDKARQLRREAESQLKLLTDTESLAQSDFYSYRYFASEGFLPGYNFPRLPLSAFIPGRRQVREGEEFLSRPRFLAISEFGPRSIIYHEGSRYVINKVLLPVEQGPMLQRAKQCQECGYIHPIEADAPGPELCERCASQLPQERRNLFRLQNVSTKRRDRISSDEEERMRQGYEIQTGVRFETRDGKLSPRAASLANGSGPVVTMQYGDAATLWRVNLGLKRRKIEEQEGFVLDMERGFWATKKDEEEDLLEPDELSKKTQRVVPYVEDRRNCLLVFPVSTGSPTFMPSLQAALKNAIQVCFQLEEGELAAEPLPTRANRNLLLFYESAEGGAGALRRLLEGQDAWQGVARTALDICHFNPDTGEDKNCAPHASEPCVAACYDCLMSYGNQWDHEHLDRHEIRDFLLDMARGKLEVSSSGRSRADHLAGLLDSCESDLERNWLDFLVKANLRLPTRAQAYVETCRTRPDFCYEDCQAVIYVDGPVHDFPNRHARDLAQTEAMEDLGYLVIRFGHREDWTAKVARYRTVFGGKG